MAGGEEKNGGSQAQAAAQIQGNEREFQQFRQALHRTTDNRIVITRNASGPSMADSQGNRVTKLDGKQPLTIECANGRSESAGHFFPDWFAAKVAFHGHGPGIVAESKETPTGSEMQLGIIESPLTGRCNVLQADFEDLGAPLQGMGQPPAKGGRGGP